MTSIAIEKSIRYGIDENILRIDEKVLGIVSKSILTVSPTAKLRNEENHRRAWNYGSLTYVNLC